MMTACCILTRVASTPMSEARRSLPSFQQAARRLSETGRLFYSHGWMRGTSGNLSAVVRRKPLRLAITESSVPKGHLTPKQILEVDERGQPVRKGSGRPSAETLLHCVLARVRGAGAVLHTHSVWSTILSDVHAAAGSVVISGYEMEKGFAGVGSHEHREVVPILEN